MLLRLLTKEDREALVEFFGCVPTSDLRFFRNNVHDRDLVGSWVDNLDYQKALPLIAVMNERLVGDTTLHFRMGPECHLAWMRIFIHKELRNRGLGLAMLHAQIDHARTLGVQQLVAEIPATQVEPVRALKQLGFQHGATLPDFFMTSDGTHIMWKCSPNG